MKSALRFPWVLAAAIAVGIIGLAVTFVKVPRQPSNPRQRLDSESFVLRRIDSSENDLTVEQLAAYDPTPLFLPSPLSSSERVFRPEAGGLGGAPFGDLKPALKFEKTLKTLEFPIALVVPEKAIDGLRLTESREKSLTLGHGGIKLAKLPDRLALVEATAVTTGRVVLTLAMNSSTAALTDDWQPLELVGAVNRAGLIGNLAIVESSGSDLVDAFFVKFIAKNAQVGARLLPGTYLFRVGP